MFIIVAYDIVENKRRTKIMKTLKGYGFHVQKSVFECFLNERQLLRLKGIIGGLIDENEDSVRFYRLPEDLSAQVEILGQGEVSKNPILIVY